MLEVLQSYYSDKQVIVDLQGTTVTLLKRTQVVEFEWDQWVEWRNGKLIQDAFPSHDADDRELIMTGITTEEWDQMFGEEE